MPTRTSGESILDGQASPDAADDNDDTKIELLIAEGLDLMEKDEVSKALRTLMKAIDTCPCDTSGNGKARHRKEKSCTIRQWYDAVTSDDPEALYKMTQGPCACGYEWPSCTRPMHALAVDALADCLNKAEQHVSAFSTALATIRLDPASPVGYCRVARILQFLLKNHSPASPVVASAAVKILKWDENPPSALLLRRMLVLFLERALHNTVKYRRGPKTRYNIILQQMAFSLKIDVSKRDPARQLPTEVMSMIFSSLSITDLSRCMRVNRQWCLLIRNDGRLWMDLRFGRPGNPGRVLPKFLQQHQQQIRTLVIRDTSDFQLTPPKLCTILRLPHLKRLCLSARKPYRDRRQVLDLSAEPAAELQSLKASPVRAQLTQLSMVSFHLGRPVMQLTHLYKETLQVLDIINTDADIYPPYRYPPLPNLKRLRMVNEDPPAGRQSAPPRIELRCLQVATPNLEQFYLAGFNVAWGAIVNELVEGGQESLWPSLSKLVLGPRLFLAPYVDWRSGRNQSIPILGPDTRSIEILDNNEELAHAVLMNTLLLSPDPPVPVSAPPASAQPPREQLPNLEVFRCKAALDPALLHHILAPAAKAGTLQVLELSIPNSDNIPRLIPAAGGDPPPIPDNPHPATYFAGLHCDNIHTLGLHDFNFFHDPTDRWGTMAQFDGQPFLDWLECFPKLHTVAVYPRSARYEGLDVFIAKLVVHPRVRVIYQDCLWGVGRDHVLKLAGEHGVVVRHEVRGMPVEWETLED